MSIFALEEIEAVVGKVKYFNLLIDGHSQYGSFMKIVKDNPQYVSEMKTILAYMNLAASLTLLPRSKHNILPNNDGVKEYEFKSDHIRAYTIHIEKTGRVVVYWGFKNNQEADLKTFRSLKKQLLQTLKS